MPTSVDPTKNLGPDSTATFESDPTFIESNPTGNASTENVNVQRDTDDVEDGDVDETDDDDLGDEDDDEEYDDDDEDDEDDEDDDAEEEDDAEEVSASAASESIPEDQDTGDIPMGVNEDDLDDDLDDDTVTSGVPAASLLPSTPSQHLSI